MRLGFLDRAIEQKERGRSRTAQQPIVEFRRLGRDARPGESLADKAGAVASLFS